MSRKHSIEGFFGSKRRIASKERKSGSQFGTCPLCRRNFPLHTLETHASACQGRVSLVAANLTERKCRQKVNLDDGDLLKEGNRKKRASEFWQQHSLLQKKRQKYTKKQTLQPSLEPIPGLLVFDNFLSESECAQILEVLDSADSWKRQTHSGSHGEQRWGIHHELWSRQVHAVKNPIPSIIRTLVLPKFDQIFVCRGIEMNDVNAIDYHRDGGDYLRDHVDDRQKHLEPIANLSIAGSCYMTFQNTRDPKQPAKKVLLPPGTLQVLTGKARYDYSHGIRNSDLQTKRRVSLTLRYTR